MVALIAGGSGRSLPAALGLATMLLGAFAFWAHQQEAELYDTEAGRNTALTDSARTSEVKGQVVDAVNKAFTYDYNDIAKTDKAAQDLLTGPAIRQYNTMFAKVREQAVAKKLILTTKVTDAAIKTLRGDTARLLIFADQYNNQGTDGRTAYITTMLAVDAVRSGGHWRISGLDTFSGTS